MKMQSTLVLWIVVFLCLFLIWLIFLWLHYLVQQKYLVECFTDAGSPETNHNVDMPINTTYQCENMCGPQARCSKTGEQCTSDVDCYGCQPLLPYKNDEKKPLTKDVPGDFDSGKLLSSQMPAYSTLTTDIGTFAGVYNNNAIDPPPEYYKGVNVWKSGFYTTMNLFNERYDLTPEERSMLPYYPSRYTLSGEFQQKEPLPANF